MGSTDETLTCVECDAPFPFTEKDKVFYESKGFERPKRCKDCRAKKKARLGK